jgi:hypothetical protein
MDETFEATGQLADVEIDEQSDMTAGESKVGENLGVMDGRELIDGLHLDDDLFLDQEIEPISAIDPYSSINDRKFHLACHLEPSPRKLKRQTGFISRLQQPRPQLAMHRDRRTDDRVCQLIDWSHYLNFY